MEAYATESTIRREERRMFAYYQNYQTGFRSAIKGVARSATGAASGLILGVSAGFAVAFIRSGVNLVPKTSEDAKVDKEYSKRDMANTYVW